MLIRFIPWILLFIFKSFVFYDSRGSFLILCWQVGALREVAPCVLNGQAGLTIKGIKASRKPHKNMGKRDLDKEYLEKSTG